MGIMGRLLGHGDGGSGGDRGQAKGDGRRGPLCILSGRTNDGRWHQWSLFEDRLQVDSQIYVLGPSTTVGFDCREPTTLDHVRWEESQEERFDWWAALATYQHTGSLGDALMVGQLLADTTMEQVHTTERRPGYVSLFVHGLASGRRTGLSATFVQQGDDCQCAEAASMARMIEVQVARLR